MLRERAKYRVLRIERTPRTQGSATMFHVLIHEPLVQTIALSLVGSLVLGWLVIHGGVMWSERRRRRMTRGFRTMKSTAQFQRERGRGARWRQPVAPQGEWN